MRYEVEVKLHNDFIKVDGNKILVGITSKPVNGKGNLEIIKKIASHFDVSSSQVKILSGLRSRRKMVEISGK